MPAGLRVAASLRFLTLFFGDGLISCCFCNSTLFSLLFEIKPLSNHSGLSKHSGSLFETHTVIVILENFWSQFCTVLAQAKLDTRLKNCRQCRCGIFYSAIRCETCFDIHAFTITHERIRRMRHVFTVKRWDILQEKWLPVKRKQFYAACLHTFYLTIFFEFVKQAQETGSIAPTPTWHSSWARKLTQAWKVFENLWTSD